MRLKDYLKGKNREKFANSVGTTKNYLNLLACGSRRASPELALKIQKEAKGAVTVLELLYPKLSSKEILHLMLGLIDSP